MAWNGNDQGETHIRSNTNHAAKALEKSWVCKHRTKERLKYDTTSWPCSGDHSHSVTVFWCCVELRKTQISSCNCCSHQSREMAKQNKTKQKTTTTTPPPQTTQWKRKSSTEDEWRNMNFKVPKIARSDKIPFYVCAKPIQGRYLKIRSNIPLTNQPRVICASQL